MKRTSLLGQPRRSCVFGEVFFSLFARFAVHRTDLSRQHRPPPQIVCDRQQREVQAVLLQSFVTTACQRSAHLPVGEHPLNARAHLRPAMVERHLARSQLAAARVETKARLPPGLPQAAAPVGVAIGRAGIHRRLGAGDRPARCRAPIPAWSRRRVRSRCRRPRQYALCSHARQVCRP